MYSRRKEKQGKVLRRMWLHGATLLALQVMRNEMDRERLAVLRGKKK